MTIVRYHSVYVLVFTIAFLSLLSITTQTFAQPNDSENIDELLEMSLEELLEVEISVASKKVESMYEAPGVVVVVPRAEFVAYGDRNLHQLMQRQPSVYTRDTFVYSDNVAAFRGDMSTVAEMHTLILFNGRPIRESAQGHNVNMYMTFPLESLESVELIRGPGSVLYGSNAFTGVINLKSRKVPEKREFSVSSMLGSLGYYETTAAGGGKYGDLGFFGAIRTSEKDGYKYSLTDAAAVPGEEDNYEESVSGAAHLEYQNLTLDFFGSDMEAFALGVLPFWSNPNHQIRNKKFFLNGGYRVPVHDRMTMEFNLTYNLQENGLSSPAPWIIGTNTSDLLAEATLFANPTDNLNIVLGYLHEWRKNYMPHEDRFQSIPEYSYTPKSAYAQGDYKLGKSIKLIAGTQWNEASNGYDDFVSRFGLIFTPFKKWGLKLLRGEAFRAPVTLESDLYDPGILVGNDDLEPETITTYDAQLFYHDEKTYAALTYFYSTIEDLIIYDTSAPQMTYMNSGKQKFDGIEFEAKRFITQNWHVLGSFLHQENEEDEGLNPSVVPEDMFKFGTAYSWDWGTTSIFWSYFGVPPDIDSPLVVNPEPESLNLVTMNTLIDVSKLMGLDKGQASLTLRVENLFDEEIYVPTFAYIGVPNSFPYGPGRTFYCGLKVSF